MLARDGVRDAPWHATLSFSFMLKLGALLVLLLGVIELYWDLAAETQKDTRKDTSSECSCLFLCLSLFVLELF